MVSLMGKPVPRAEIWPDQIDVYGTDLLREEWPLPTRPFDLHVTAADIADGQRQNGWHHPVAIALRRVTGRECFVRSGEWIIGTVLLHVIGLAAQYSRDFDAGRPVSPFEITLN